LIPFLGSGCAGAKFVEFDAPEEYKPFHPPLPAPIYPVFPKPRALTPDVTDAMNIEIVEGRAAPYVYMCFDLQTWITLGQYDAEVRAQLRHLYKVIEWYGHPDLAPKEPLPTVQAED
jgi:hypothetical protein